MSALESTAPSRVPPPWAKLLHLVDGARARGWKTEEQLEYLRACLAVCWAQAFVAGWEAAEK